MTDPSKLAMNQIILNDADTWAARAYDFRGETEGVVFALLAIRQTLIEQFSSEIGTSALDEINGSLFRLAERFASTEEDQTS